MPNTQHVNPKHRVHIVAVSAEHFTQRQNGICEYTLDSSHLIIARRHELELTDAYRQILLNTIFTHQGKVWAYRRTPKGGEAELHDKVALSVGGHWDLSDLILDEDGLIDLPASVAHTTKRELSEEVRLGSKVVSQRTLPFVIVADDTPVDRKHVAMITVVELDGEHVHSAEDELDDIGFMSPSELLSGQYPLETWARMICQMLLKSANPA